MAQAVVAAAVPEEATPATLVVSGIGTGFGGVLVTWWALSAADQAAATGGPSTGITGWTILGMIAAVTGCAMFLVGLHRSLSRHDALVALLTDRLLSERPIGAAAADAPASPPADRRPPGLLGLTGLLGLLGLPGLPGPPAGRVPG